MHFYTERKIVSESDQASTFNCQLTETTEDRGTQTTPRERYWQNPDNGETYRSKNPASDWLEMVGGPRDYKRLKSHHNQSQRKEGIYILTHRTGKRKEKRSNMYANVKLDICTVYVDIYSLHLFKKFFSFLSKFHAQHGA